MGFLTGTVMSVRYTPSDGNKWSMGWYASGFVIWFPWGRCLIVQWARPRPPVLADQQRPRDSLADGAPK
jgi:hypothetical protein